MRRNKMGMTNDGLFHWQAESEGIDLQGWGSKSFHSKRIMWPRKLIRSNYILDVTPASNDAHRQCVEPLSHPMSPGAE